MNSSERTLMNKACTSIIRMDWRIKFASIVDQNGKLLIGKWRNHPQKKVTGRTNKGATNIDTNLRADNLRCINTCRFYSDFLLWSIERYKVQLHMVVAHPPYVEDDTSIYFDVSGWNKDEVKLAVIPLNVCMQIFLCIYFHPAYSIRTSGSSSRLGLDDLLCRVSSTVF